MMRLGPSAAAAVVAFAAAAPAHAQRTEISPYIEIGQVLSADLNDGDVLTYSQLSAGVDATVTTRRVQVNLNYQYQRFFEWEGDLGDSDAHSGLAQANVNLTRWLSLEAGGIATRARSDIRGGGLGLFNTSRDNVSQLYSVYGGPSIATRSGPFAITGSYRLGYTKAEVPDFLDLGAGQQRLDYYDDATSQLAQASIGTRPGTVAPFGFTVSGAWAREDAGQLDQYFEGRFVRADAVQPVSRTLAVVAGVGYENIEVGQRDPLVGADGLPVLDDRGRFITDPASPPRLAYDIDGVIWDAGVVWRPSPRTVLEARIGERYGTMTYIGSLSWQTGPGSGLQVGVYDAVTSFGRQLSGSLASLPTDFFSGGADPFGNRYTGCVFGGGTTPDGSVQPGGCLTPVFQSISTANFRARGVDAVYSVTRGRTRLGVGAGYSNRRYFIPDVPGATIYRTADESWYAQGFYQTALDERSGLTADIYGNYFTSGLAGASDAWGGGAQGSYYRSFGRAYGSLSGGLYTFDAEAQESDWIAQALLAFGYRF